MMKKIQKVELKHAKVYAQKEADNMLKEKLEKCRLAYEGEFEQLCSQFSEMQVELKTLKKDKIQQKQRIIYLEQIISQQNNNIKTQGYLIKQDAKDEIPPDGNFDKQQIQDLEKMYEDETVPK